MIDLLFRLAMSTLLLALLASSWFINYKPPSNLISKRLKLYSNQRYGLLLSSQDNGMFSGTDDQVLDEIKAELDLIGIDYSDLDVSQRSEYAKRLIDAQIKEMERTSSSDDDFSSRRLQVPGGLDQMTMNMLLNDPEVISLLKNPKMEDLMSVVMNGGPEAKEYLQKNPGLSITY